jgi:hypothetical protein
VFTQNPGGADLVEPHEPRISHSAGGEYRRQPAFNPNWSVHYHDESSV